MALVKQNLMLLLFVVSITAVAVTTGEQPPRGQESLPLHLGLVGGTLVEPSSEPRSEPEPDSRACLKCRRAVDRIKAHHVLIFRVTLEGLCMMTHHYWEIFSCRQIVNKIVEELEAQSTEQICEDLRLCKARV